MLLLLLLLLMLLPYELQLLPQAHALMLLYTSEELKLQPVQLARTDISILSFKQVYLLVVKIANSPHDPAF